MSKTKRAPVTMDNRTIWDALPRDEREKLQAIFPILKRRSLNA